MSFNLKVERLMNIELQEEFDEYKEKIASTKSSSQGGEMQKER